MAWKGGVCRVDKTELKSTHTHISIFYGQETFGDKNEIVNNNMNREWRCLFI